MSSESAPWRRQSSQISGGGSPVPVSLQGDSQVPPPPPPPPPSSCPPAPPPPPPPGLPGNIPAVRLSTEIPEKRRSAYEPPAAIQNAMMTKDKKPFTYTPGGLDLSEIRSPRMARRINRNANAPDAASQPRPVSVPSGPLPPSAVAAMQPQIAIPVLPQGGGVPHLNHVTPGGYSSPPPPPPPPQQPSHMYSPPPPPQQPANTFSPPPPQPPSPQKMIPQPTSPQKMMNRQPSPPPMAVPKLQPQHRHTRSEPQTSTPGSIYVPPIETQQPRSQLGSLYIPPLVSQETVKPQSPVSQLNKAPTPWMSRQNQQAPKEVPPWVNRETVQSPPPQSQNQQQPQTRIIPIQIEGKEPASKPNERIIPIQLEGTPSPQPQSQPPQYYSQPPSYQQPQQQQYQQANPGQQQYQQATSGRQTPQNPRWMNQQPVYVHNKFNSGSQSPAPAEPTYGGSQQPSWRASQTNGGPQSPGPVQSQSFKVLQKITGTDGVDQNDAPYNSQGVPLSQLRKLQLSDDDRALMDKVKSQVDDETYLHNESDPRYRGSAIPSRAFRILQNMTDGSGEGFDVPQAYSPVQGGQNRLAANRTPQPDAAQQYVPPSEQQAPEPRKYTGGAIPSRSFRMLQAMTAGNDSSAEMSDGRQTPQIYNGGEVMWAPNNYPYPPPLPPPNPNYYYYPSPPPPPPQTAEQQQQFWDHYNAMCSYVAEMNNSYGYPPYGYPPHLYTPPPPQSLQYASDSDECGYSSTDEMNYYAAYFKKYPPPIQPYRTYYSDNRAQTPQIVITPSRSYGNNGYSSDIVSDSEKETNQNKSFISSSPSVNGDSGETTTDDGSDTEVEEDNIDRPQGLQTIRSVPDISVYKDSSTSDIQSQNSETDEPDEETNEDEEEYEEDLPHQLSVIFEESEHSEVESLNKMKCRNLEGDTTSEGDSSTATLDNGDDTDDDIVDAESSTVLVRLPLKFQFSKTENNEDLTTVIVGDSEIESSPEAEVRPGDLIIQEVKRVIDEPDVSVTFTIPKKKSKPAEVANELSGVENNEEEFLAKQNIPDDNQELASTSNEDDSKEVICDKEVSVVVNCDETINNKNVNEDRCKSESPIDFWKELSCDDTPVKPHVPADVSVSITLPPKSLTKSGSRSPFNTLTSESDDSRPEESDGHWEDDSSSTSVQTVCIGKRSGSDHFSGSEVENCGTADEVEDIQKVSSPYEVESKVAGDGDGSKREECIEDDHEKIPIEDLLYDDTSSSDDDDDESSTSSSSSESSEESSAVSEQSKEAKRPLVASNDSSRAEEKCDDDVFLSENSKSEASNHLKVEQKPKKVHGASCKSQDESEEDDSGVTSDMSRHISETDTEPECGSELRKLTPYQRASTHSRLFKLLQDECSAEDDDQNISEGNVCDTESISSRKERLSLPLQTYTPSDPDSLSSSSGINSPVSPTVNDRLVRELVQSLLNKKKSRHFRKLPMEKLYAAALRILQEDMDPYDTLSSTSDDSFQHSPISETTASQANCTASNLASQTQEVYGGNYYDYCDYYNTWGNPYYYSDVEDSLGYDIIPSRAFKLLQERAQTPHGFSSGVIEGLVAKCPRVLSSKDVPKDLDEVPVPGSCPQASSSSET